MIRALAENSACENDAIPSSSPLIILMNSSKNVDSKQSLPYRRKFHRGKVTKRWIGDKNFPRWKIVHNQTFTRRVLSNNQNFLGKVTKLPYFSPMNALFNALNLMWALTWEDINTWLAVKRCLKEFKGGLSFRKRC